MRSIVYKRIGAHFMRKQLILSIVFHAGEYSKMEFYFVTHVFMKIIKFICLGIRISVSFSGFLAEKFLAFMKIVAFEI